MADGTWYLGFDISTSLGWNLRDSVGKVRAHGVLALVPGAGGRALTENRRRIDKVIKAAQAVAGAGGATSLEPAVEDVEFTKFTKSHASYWRVRTLIELAVHDELGCPSIELVVGVTALKSHAMGGKGRGEGPRGQVTKRQMVEACRKRDEIDLPPWEVTTKGAPTAESKRSGDQADAAHVTHWAWESGKSH